MVRKILKYGAPVLEQAAEAVTSFDDELAELVSDMWDTMYAAKGVGLAAPQIGVSKRITVIDVTAGEDTSKRLVIINPEIVSKEGKQTDEEGCLSLPGFREPVTRAEKVCVRAFDEKGEPFEIEGEQLLARACLHEIDHLNGVMFITHLSTLKRDIIRRKIRKLQKAGDWD